MPNLTPDPQAAATAVLLSVRDAGHVSDALDARADALRDQAGDAPAYDDGDALLDHAQHLTTLAAQHAAAASDAMRWPITPATEAVVATLLLDPRRLALAVARAMATAGAVVDWDASTIEDVLADLVDVAHRGGLPTFTSASGPGDPLTYWRRVADEQGIEHDGPSAADDDGQDEL